MSTHVPARFLTWLGLRLGPEADLVTCRLDWRWQWAPWATLLLLLAVITWTIVLYTRESSAASRLYRTTLTVLRLVALGLLLFMIGEWSVALQLTGPPTVALVIDRSASMSIVDRFNDPRIATELSDRLGRIALNELSRFNLAKLLVAEDNGQRLRELAARYRLDLYLTGATVERQSLSSDIDEAVRSLRQLQPGGTGGETTRLGDAVRTVLGDAQAVPPAAIILLSDGVTTAGVPLADAAQDARAKGVPIVAVGIGNEQPPTDIEVVDVLVDDIVFVNERVRFQVQSKATGFAGQSTKVLLRRTRIEGAGNSPGAAAIAAPTTVVAEQSVVLPSDGAFFTMQISDQPSEGGRYSYEVVVVPRPEETDHNNNVQQRTVSVRDDKIRVLMVQAYPNFEFRWLKTLLERDPTIELSVHLQAADPEFAVQDKSALSSVPLDRDELFAYDVLLFGDVDPRLLPISVWQNLRAFVSEKGGGAALIAGPNFLPGMYADNPDVAALLPVEIDDATAGKPALPGAVTQAFVVQPTSVGMQSSALQLGETPAVSEQIWRELPPHYWLAECARVKPGAQVYAEHPSLIGAAGRKLPVICFQYVGAGRVLLHAIDSTWRWRLRAGDTYFARYWMQTIRFLARGKLASGAGAVLTSDRRAYSLGEPVHLRARFLEPRSIPHSDEVTVLADSSGQMRRHVSLRRNVAADGVFEGSLADLPEGEYEAVLADAPAAGAPLAVRFVVASPPGEFARQEMDAAALASAAAVSRGKFYTLQDADRLLAELPAGSRVAREHLPPIPLWNRWWILAAFLTCLTAEWVLRKRAGML